MTGEGADLTGLKQICHGQGWKPQIPYARAREHTQQESPVSSEFGEQQA